MQLLYVLRANEVYEIQLDLSLYFSSNS